MSIMKVDYVGSEADVEKIIPSPAEQIRVFEVLTGTRDTSLVTEPLLDCGWRWTADDAQRRKMDI